MPVRRHIDKAHGKFIEHEELCIPPHSYLLKNLCLLARSLIIRHFTCNFPNSSPQIEIRTFPSIQDPRFKEYLESSGIYFIMCHDGAYAPVQSTLQSRVINAEKGDWQKVAFRKMICHFISSGFNVALVNGLEVKDSKVGQIFHTSF